MADALSESARATGYMMAMRDATVILTEARAEGLISIDQSTELCIRLLDQSPCNRASAKKKPEHLRATVGRIIDSLTDPDNPNPAQPVSESRGCDSAPSNENERVDIENPPASVESHGSAAGASALAARGGE